MTKTTNLIKELKLADQKIQEQYKNKIAVIDSFLQEISDICNIFHALWEEKENDIENQLKGIAKNHNFTLQMGGNDKLAYYNILHDLTNKFPIYNADEQNIIDDLPSTSHNWYFLDRSNDEQINIEVSPIDNNSRYRNDPDDNILEFTYIMDKEIHNVLINSSLEDKKHIIEQYFDKKVNEYFMEIDTIIKEKSGIIKDSLKNIDFDNPQVVAELKSKLRMN